MKLTRPETEPNEVTRSALKRIDLLEIRTSYPLLLRLFESHASGSLSFVDLHSCLSLIESFAVRRQVCGVPTNSLNKLFLQWCRNYPPTNHVVWLTDTLQAGNGIRRWPTDIEFSLEFQKQPQYGRGATSFVLRRLEESFNHPEAVDLNQVTIEHVLPQTLTEDWKVILGKDWETDHDELLHTFGNLTLTGFNSELGNRSFEEKKRMLEHTHIELNRWILHQQNWGRLENRAKSFHTLRTSHDDLAGTATPIITVGCPIFATASSSLRWVPYHSAQQEMDVPHRYPTLPPRCGPKTPAL